MKTVTGRIISAEPVSLTKAASLLINFASSDNGTSQDVSAYLQRVAAAFTELKSIHREILSSSLEETNPRSDVTRDRNPTVEFDGRAKAIDDLVGKGGKIRDRKSEAAFESPVLDTLFNSICARDDDPQSSENFMNWHFPCEILDNRMPKKSKVV
ncbi:unnamed protein product [Arabis nemorensis]|uniref:Uncharacterized protein n=1 Tax=Arabis nemorensis TaxID=586526 RepID=A0A565CSH4_9BRAS|nr:unnamed protein product [Arabis nemorensis]